MKHHVHRIGEELWAVLLFIAAIWGVFFLDLLLPLEQWGGVIPRSLSGMVGIFTMPFLHGDYQHLINNSVPLLVLLVLLAGSKADSRVVVPVISVLGAFLLWIFGRDAVHIGASVLVFGLATFLIFSGLLERRMVSLLISLLVVFLYGSTLLMGVLPGQQGVSWEGHLFGAIAGAIVAWGLLRVRT